ncbi:PREDICTED: zinc finger protein 512-like [Priapulus caudatus]|uniref:Zinc finger protein 512-like n=1 Tax=Priapulus caudatus TaxID=37621 RepID=A0ABM1F690_PRICU|nr:PREDICTED: zinc finger protein 512-like [Priapulus caudatus]
MQAKATSFSCQICGKEIKNKASLNYHFMAEHNGLEEEMRDDDSPDKRRTGQNCLALKVVLKKQGKLRCQVRDCGRSFLSADGYLYHWKTCGKEVIYGRLRGCAERS